MLGLLTISATYTRKNQNMSIDEGIEQNIELFRIAESGSIPFVMALGMAFWCAYEGLIPEDNVIAVVRRLHDSGIRRFYLAGSLGMEDPAHVNRLFRRLGDLFPDTFSAFTSTISPAWRPPIFSPRSTRAFSGSRAICGIGGGIRCRPGSVPSVIFQLEDLVAMLAEMEIDRHRPRKDSGAVPGDCRAFGYRSAEPPRQRRHAGSRR